MKTAVIFFMALFGFNAIAHANCDESSREAYQLKQGKIKQMTAQVSECAGGANALVRVEFPNGVYFSGDYEGENNTESLDDQPVISIKPPKALSEKPNRVYRCVTNQLLQRKKEGYCFSVL